MKVRKLDTENPRDVNQFIRFPFGLYKNCEQWVPPLISDMKLVMNRRKHPFYQHSEADFFIAESEDDVLGRVAVLHNRNYCQHHKTQTAFFYFYEVIEDKQVSDALLDAIVKWCKQRQLNRIMGPKGFLRSSGMGTLVKGFEFTPAMGIPYNFAYYPSLLEAWGFEKLLDQFSGHLEAQSYKKLPERLHEIAEKVKQRGNFWVKSFKNANEMRQWIPYVKKVQEVAFLDNPNYYPSTDAEFSLIANSMIQIARPRMIKLVMKGNEVAGFVISYPNISRGLKKSRGKLFPLGWLYLLWDKWFTKVVDFNGVGLLPQYQGLGANAMLYVELEKTIRQFGFERGEFVQVNEDNFKSKSDWDNIGIIYHKIHRTYQYSL